MSYTAYYEKRSDGDGELRLVMDNYIDDDDLPKVTRKVEELMNEICGEGRWTSITAEECDFNTILEANPVKPEPTGDFHSPLKWYVFTGEEKCPWCHSYVTEMFLLARSEEEAKKQKHNDALCRMCSSVDVVSFGDGSAFIYIDA